MEILNKMGWNLLTKETRAAEKTPEMQNNRILNM
jgi:hypothetical protein